MAGRWAMDHSEGGHGARACGQVAAAVLFQSVKAGLHRSQVVSDPLRGKLAALPLQRGHGATPFPEALGSSLVASVL